MSETTQEWFKRMETEAVERHHAESLAGQHDEQCEWLLAFQMCHCHRRKRLAEGKTVPPVLIYTSPECDGCWKPCSHDGDGWYCGTCEVYFGDRYDEPGEWQDEHAKDDAELLRLRTAAIARSEERWANQYKAERDAALADVARLQAERDSLQAEVERMVLNTRHIWSVDELPGGSDG